MSKYLIGADPELFLMDQNNEFRSAHNVIPGTKDSPFPVLNGAIQVDGVAAEFNINPASSADQFCEHIRDVLTELQSRIDTRGKGYALHVTPTARFDKKYFQKLPKRSKLLGCEPDRNAYSASEFQEPPSTTEPFRTGGGHIHIGWTNGQSPTDGAHLYDCIQMTKQLDCCLFLLSPLWDDDSDRRKLYGRVGSFRPKHYGSEYRPLSNAWVADPDLHRWVFNATLAAAAMLDDDIDMSKDPMLANRVLACQSGISSTRGDAKRVHAYLAEEYQFPELPDSYLARA